MELVFDIEADSLTPTEIHCIAAIDENDKHYTFDIIDGNIEEGIEFLSRANKLIGHNIIGFDMPAIHKLHGVNLWHKDKVIDTLVLSRLLNPVGRKVILLRFGVTSLELRSLLLPKTSLTIQKKLLSIVYKMLF